MGLYFLPRTMALLSTIMCVSAQPEPIECDGQLIGCGFGIGSGGQNAQCTCVEFVPSGNTITGTAFCDLQDLVGATVGCCECLPGMSSTWADSAPDPRNCTSEENLQELKRIVRRFENLGKKIQKKCGKHPAPSCICDPLRDKEVILSQKLTKLNKDIQIECGFVSSSESSSQPCD